MMEEWNMFQLKEKDKTLEKELNETEISNLPDK